ncbi:MAG: endonuclease/exonuclease/phosphatase family protein [Bdellovibrionales bacterium]|nr:endonuclease/exonuclease/phosphatase family protein [Bdellovibrionales bacterium]
MKILTYNLWHGISPKGKWNFAPLETRLRRQQRFLGQERLLKQFSSELVFLQEVNPLHERTKELAKIQGDSYFCQPDATGIKIKSKGWPWILNSGLAILIPKSWRGRYLQHLKLSGSKWSYLSQQFSLQWKESRYALLVEFVHPKWGRTLAVNCHLHHGLELTEDLEKKIKEFALEGLLTTSALGELKGRLQAGNLRREEELSVLLQVLKQKQVFYDTIIVGGDFNLTERSQGYKQLVDFGLQDLWLLNKNNPAPEISFTFDPASNFANQIFNQNFPLTVEYQDLSFSPKTRQTLSQLLQAQEQKPRRIDYVFIWSKNTPISLESSQRIGLPDLEGFAPSDHFGLSFKLS